MPRGCVGLRMFLYRSIWEPFDAIRGDFGATGHFPLVSRKVSLGLKASCAGRVGLSAWGGVRRRRTAPPEADECGDLSSSTISRRNSAGYGGLIPALVGPSHFKGSGVRETMSRSGERKNRTKPTMFAVKTPATVAGARRWARDMVTGRTGETSARRAASSTVAASAAWWTVKPRFSWAARRLGAPLGQTFVSAAVSPCARSRGIEVVRLTSVSTMLVRRRSTGGRVRSLRSRSRSP